LLRLQAEVREIQTEIANRPENRLARAEAKIRSLQLCDVELARLEELLRSDESRQLDLQLKERRDSVYREAMNAQHEARNDLLGTVRRLDYARGRLQTVMNSVLDPSASIQNLRSEFSIPPFEVAHEDAQP